MTDPRFMRPGLPFALAKVIEECGEVISAAGKTLQWGTDSCDPTKPATERENKRLSDGYVAMIDAILNEK